MCYNANISIFVGYIRPILGHFVKTTGFWSLFFLLSFVSADFFIFDGPDRFFAYKRIETLGVGGPSGALDEEFGAVSSYGYSYEQPDAAYDTYPNIVSADDVSVLGLSSPLAKVVERNGIKKYKVQYGDTLSSIAAEFGITMDTIRAANPDVRSSLKKGQELVILPVSGILYRIKGGDTIESVAGRFQVRVGAIKEYNPNYVKLFDSPSATVILPYAKAEISIARSEASYMSSLPDLGGYFSLPAKGWNWGKLHEYNAVDIADSCGSPVYAAADGIVVEESSDGSWNSGYGNYVKIEHNNGAETRYAHTLKNLVKVGNFVSRGEQISLIGNSGNTRGLTGCHLHFEVYGAKNPFAVK